MLNGLAKVIFKLLFKNLYLPVIAYGTIVALVFSAKDTTPYLIGNNRLFSYSSSVIIFLLTNSFNDLSTLYIDFLNSFLDIFLLFLSSNKRLI